MFNNCESDALLSIESSVAYDFITTSGGLVFSICYDSKIISTFTLPTNSSFSDQLIECSKQINKLITPERLELLTERERLQKEGSACYERVGEITKLLNEI